MDTPENQPEGPAQQPPDGTLAEPEEDLEQSAGRRRRKLIGVGAAKRVIAAGAALTAAVALAGDLAKSSSGSEANTAPVIEVQSSSNINGIDLGAKTPEEATQKLLERTAEGFGDKGKIIPELQDSVVVLEAGTVVYSEPGNDILGLPRSAVYIKTGRFVVPDEYVLVVDRPWKYGNQASDYLNMTIGDIHAEGRAIDPKLNWWLNVISAYRHGKFYVRPGQTGGTVQGGVNAKGNPTFDRTPSSEIKAGVLIKASSLPDLIKREHLEPPIKLPVGN